MSSEHAYDQTIPYPQVFIVDRGGHPNPHGTLPNLVPCWSFPPAHETVTRPERSRGCMGASSRLVGVVLLLFALVFASLGMGAMWTVNLQKQLKDMRKMVNVLNSSTENMINAPQKQIGLYDPPLKEDKKVDKDRPAAHVMWHPENVATQKTLRWDPSVGRAFTAGGVSYMMEDSALQVNQTGLYYIYSRVELLFRTCLSTSFEHTVFVRRPGRNSPLTLMKSHRKGYCPPKQEAWTTDSFLGSALHLQKDDRVLVDVSHPHLLSHEHYANFFGLYKI
ncbi:tumor necrosis factor ligand superfamily member 6 [Periophthalmus magnuspinnatus]|uniref:tumor necrosis factor ligand superfamily member 6 n=1 Tax=Periophthalmus magnuspinnatus TaxID=409849 RepID=UPI00145AF60C|nr:tumor necrosis factor ligand superfamily member 6 [Periophthalmus magnuspinnatus]